MAGIRSVWSETRQMRQLGTASAPNIWLPLVADVTRYRLYLDSDVKLSCVLFTIWVDTVYGHFGPWTFRHQDTSALVPKCSDSLDQRQFGTKTEMSRSGVSGCRIVSWIVMSLSSVFASATNFWRTLLQFNGVLITSALSSPFISNVYTVPVWLRNSPLPASLLPLRTLCLRAYQTELNCKPKYMLTVVVYCFPGQ